MKKKRINKLNFEIVRVASLNKIQKLLGGEETHEETCTEQGQTNTATGSTVVRNCTVVGSRDNCLSDDC